MNIVKDNENWLLIFKIVPGGVPCPLAYNGKAILWAEGRYKLDHPALRVQTKLSHCRHADAKKERSYSGSRQGEL
jgi:hypothetical protein